MAKSTVDAIVAKIKRRVDYDITDTDLDTLLIDMINDSVKLISQWMYDQELLIDNTAQSSFQTIPGQPYRDIRVAVIVGDTTTFTGIAGDTLNVSIDGTTYADVDISAATDIDDVVTAINTAVGSTVASNNSTSTTLQITSLTTGATSSVTIADGTSTTQTVVGDLFSSSADRTQNGIVDVDDILQISERVNDTVPQIIPFDEFMSLYPDYSEDTSNTATHISIINNRIYFGPSPSSYVRYYIDYVKFYTDLVSGDTLPFQNKYDAVLIAQVRLEFLQFFDANNIQTITTAKGIRDSYRETLINSASNRKLVRQSASRNEGGFIGPQSPETGTFT